MSGYCVQGDDGLYRSVSDGMSLRDVFAMKAMETLIAKIPLVDVDGKIGRIMSQAQADAIRIGVAESAYNYADAMLAERNKYGGAA